jgi:hypothetical protein
MRPGREKKRMLIRGSSDPIDRFHFTEKKETA